jgi:hypothetical protein
MRLSAFHPLQTFASQAYRRSIGDVTMQRVGKLVKHKPVEKADGDA